MGHDGATEGEERDMRSLLSLAGIVPALLLLAENAALLVSAAKTVADAAEKMNRVEQELAEVTTCHSKKNH